MEERLVEIPDWFMWLQGVVTPILTLICGAALGVLWKMRQELTILNVKMEATTSQKAEIDQLWRYHRQLERRIDRHHPDKEEQS